MSEYIPMSQWARDHWSTLAYIETVLVDQREFTVSYNPRMRSSRRMIRVLTEPPALRTATVRNRSYAYGRGAFAMSPEAGTILRDGTVLPDHDDWACVQDFAAAGLLTKTADEIDVGTSIKFSPYGWHIATALRQHKANGGNFADFSPTITAEDTP